MRVGIEATGHTHWFEAMLAADKFGDDADRLTAVTDPANNTTQYAYDTESNLLSITDANNHATSAHSNRRNRQASFFDD